MLFDFISRSFLLLFNFIIFVSLVRVLASDTTINKIIQYFYLIFLISITFVVVQLIIHYTHNEFLIRLYSIFIDNIKSDFDNASTLRASGLSLNRLY